MTIQLSGVGSGIDTASIVQELVQANSGTLDALETQSQEASDANSTLSGIGTQMASLSTAATALADATANGSFTATTTDTSIGVTAGTGAQPGTYQVQVNAIAAAQRTYSAAFSSSTTALGQAGTVAIQVGTGTAVNVSVNAGDSLSSIAAKINDANAGVTASVFSDGTNSRLQIGGLNTGAANAINFTETGTTLDLNGDGSTESGGITVQKAQDASLTIDGFNVTRPTNQITGAVDGLTLALTNKTTSPASVTIAADSTGLTTNLNAVVTAYNAIVSSIHSAVGYGTVAATNPELSADPALTQIASNLSAAMSASSSQSGSLTTLPDIGLTLQEDGTLSLDTTKLSTAYAANPLNVQNLLGRLHDQTKGGLMANLNDLVNSLDGSAGPLVARENSLTAEGTTLTQEESDAQDQLDSYQAQMTAEFTAMNTTYTANQQLITQLQSIGTSTTA